MQKFNRIFMLVAVALFFESAIAAGIPTVGELAQIQAETVLIKARAKQEEARSELSAKRSTGVSDDGTLPVVKSILGADRRMIATLIYPGNVVVEAALGDMVPGGYKVVKIHEESNKVDLLKGKQHFTVGFSTVVPTAKQQTGSIQSVQGGPAPYVPGIAR